MEEIAAVGPDAGVLGFAACGIKVFPVKNAEEAAGIIKKIIGKYAIILVSETFIDELKKNIRDVETGGSSMILPLPMLGRSSGKAKERIERFIRGAIGIPGQSV
ncbi:hypothetical protein COS16_06840 [Candidatus Desantisbacteria bacterium CG02_land_8_20_14_3_00_49_13]|nr:MAG: hypothetical protein AUJ67_07475 [Candidatus Desantisbacteria bacterium CG1_02_49_89]PIV55547.1 MAG: hypothetical protein COS16_06840 [Candidatus Desantisbacteria bacterium CG02_land_8_20_14_3_00_49_13]